GLFGLPFVEIREGLPFARTAPVAAARRTSGRLKSSETVVDVGDEAELAHLAISNDVNAEVDLLLHHGGDGGADAAGNGGSVHMLAGLLAAHEIDQVVRARQAADMGGEDAVLAGEHVFPLVSDRPGALPLVQLE